ncbi:MAG: hypothetical protein H6581_30455 [Bacteroidia bacterium]|nr:hypothetical protein [Bacteroidia bacterium]
MSDENKPIREGLFQLQWPPPCEYPLNEGQKSVEKWIHEDFDNSKVYKIITGFTSLSYLLAFFEFKEFKEETKVTILLGHEPIPEDNRKLWKTVQLSQKIKDYWINQGFSITESGGVVRMIELIKSKKIDFRFTDRLHAKIYLSETHAILGSSNFSKAGLRDRSEANIRRSIETNAYHQINLIASNFIDDSTEFNSEMIKLLGQLLRLIRWREALARAISELLGEWIEHDPNAAKMLKGLNLWPIQKSAIGQALSVLDNQGSALIADPTGAGKTRTNAALQMAIILRQQQKGNFFNDRSVVVCPPAVEENWNYEFGKILFSNYKLISHGKLSNPHNDSYKDSIRWLESCHILVVDEAHNFLRRTSKRSETLLNSSAEMVVLATATPINRKAEDLLRIVEMLDIDNLPDEALAEYKELRRKRSLMTLDEKERLKDHIGKFIVRRTKSAINKLIDHEQHLYKNNLGELCRYPKHNQNESEIIYFTGETEEDRALAKEINAEAEKLKGLINLQHLWILHDQKGDKEKQKKHLDRRLNSAAILARYKVRASLRSSNAALIEHIYGTDAALEKFDFQTEKASSSGNMIKTLEGLMINPPESTFEIEIPDWLSDPQKYKQACLEEIEKYKKIGSLVMAMKPNRELKKVQFLAESMQKHKLLLAFDSTPLTLSFLKKELESRYPEIDVLVVTGGKTLAKKKATKWFGLGSTEKNKIALLSDAMSEGVNLQQASAMVFLDVPGVTRIAEQRIGRLDRLDSPHKEISIFWPDDSDEFALKKDERLAATLELVDDMIGANIRLPQGYKNSSIQAKDAIKDFKEHQKKDKTWEGIQYAFKPVQDLIGNSGLISEADYDIMKGVTAKIKSGVSLVPGNKPWGFFCIRGSDNHAPRWLYFEPGKPPETELALICKKLNENLKNSDDIPWNPGFSKIIKQYVDSVHSYEIELLPPKKRRALKLLRDTLEKYKKKETPGSEMYAICHDLLRVFLPHEDRKVGIDYDRFGSLWLNIVQPRLIEKRKAARSSQVFDLNSLKQELQSNPVSIDQLKFLQENIPIVDHLDRRIAACIIGVCIPEKV